MQRQVSPDGSLRVLRVAPALMFGEVLADMSVDDVRAAIAKRKRVIPQLVGELYVRALHYEVCVLEDLLEEKCRSAP